MRLIDADILLTAFPKWENEIFRTSAVRGTIEACPTVDAVPIVWCGECKYMMPNGHCTMFADDRIRPSSSDFCSAGERKDGERNEIDRC